MAIKFLSIVAGAAFLAAAVPAPAASSSSGTNSRSNRSRTAYTRSRYYTPYIQGLYAARYGAGVYGVTPYGLRGNYMTPAPLPTAAPSLPPVTGVAGKYSPVEYGEIVKMAVEAARANDPGPAIRGTGQCLLDKATTRTANGQVAYIPVQIQVSQVLDRGILLLPGGEELRLRGVYMPSITETNQTLRLYAKEGRQVLTNLTAGQTVYVLLDAPPRDSDGRLLGTVFLADGRELNSYMLSRGYGSVKPEDFARGVDFSDMEAAEDQAKTAQLGIWSRR